MASAVGSTAFSSQAAAARVAAGLASSGPPIWEMDATQIRHWILTLPGIDKATLPTLLQNLVTSITSIIPSPEPPGKRLKLEDGQKAPATPLNDPYKIWIGQSDDDVPPKFGAILAQLTHGGLVNALKAGTDVQVKKTADILFRLVQTKMERDFLETTPNRIREMLAPEISPHEFLAIRKRVYDTVVLGKGMNHAALDEEEEVVASKSDVHDIEKFKKCKVCGNNDQALFVLDRKNGDVICTNCGTICMESVMHEGSAFRKFEGEVDRNHHGDAANPLYSNAHNLSTTLGGVQVTSSVNQGWGTQSKGLENVLRNAHAYTELNISQFGKGERKTRIGYKDRQKRDAFGQMVHVGDALNLHEAVVQRAKELFAGFRDDRELVQQFKGVIAACLCEAFAQLSRDGHALLKQKELVAEESSERANRRRDLHHASMAGKGGLLLGEKETVKKETPPSPQTAHMLALEKKPAPTWDLDDCRTWLLEASRNIAQQWIKDRNIGVKNIPEGSQEELEGKLVEHTITLCDKLEAELKARETKGGGKKVVTPRVNDMAQLGIKWQHKHERGSGGKGGVGNSGHAVKKTGNGRTAGQILILKTGKKLGTMIQDPVAGNAFHKELRALAGRQEARKRKERADEATRQRLHQMKRKPWLQAKAES